MHFHIQTHVNVAPYSPFERWFGFVDSIAGCQGTRTHTIATKNHHKNGIFASYINKWKIGVSFSIDFCFEGDLPKPNYFFYGVNLWWGCKNELILKNYLHFHISLQCFTFQNYGTYSILRYELRRLHYFFVFFSYYSIKAFYFQYQQSFFLISMNVQQINELISQIWSVCLVNFIKLIIR